MKNLFARWLSKWRSYQKRKLHDRLTAYEKLIRKINVHKQERRSAIDFFCHYDDDTDRSLKALLKRFDFSDENSIVDGKEKEAALAGIIRRGPAALPIIQEYLQTKEHIAWPLKALLALSDEQTVVRALEDCLDLGPVDFEQNKVEKNYDILCHLMDYDTPCNEEKILHFLQARDERVRFAAAELLARQGSASVLPHFEPFIYDESAENRRIRATVLEAYLKRSWKLTDKQRFSKLDIPGYHINSKGGITRIKQP